MKAMAQRAELGGYTYDMFKKAMTKGPNKTYLAGKVRNAYQAAPSAAGAGAHEWFPSEMFETAIDKAADVIMDGEVASTEIKTLNMGFAWIELQHDLRTETYRIIFNKSIPTPEPTGDPMNPSVLKPMLQGHSGAIKGARDPMVAREEDVDWIPQNSFQNGGGSFHAALKEAFGSNSDITTLQSKVIQVVDDWSWQGGDVHKYCRMETGPNAGKTPTTNDATTGADECKANINSAFTAAAAKLAGE